MCSPLLGRLIADAMGAGKISIEMRSVVSTMDLLGYVFEE
ncbi:unannotated protein [freshwater metagenome]|uniref:Unannotated protein n=1 Tax=freshwater metagenome TaxID=449393 RepID=A0A6J7MJH1_9ZZZZ